MLLVSNHWKNRPPKIYLAQSTQKNSVGNYDSFPRLHWGCSLKKIPKMLILLSEANIAMWWFPWIAHFFEFRVLCSYNIVGSPICIKLFRCKLLPNSNNQKTTYIVPKMEKAGCCRIENRVDFCMWRYIHSKEQNSKKYILVISILGLFRDLVTV